LATLAHDDVMDAGVMRRRRPTLAANWGNEISVLLGDCLFAQAMRLATAFSTLEICRAIATARHTVCTGEILQTLQRGNAELSRAEYFRILNMKTGTLFALSCDLGAGLAGAKGAKRAALRQFGMALGTAYQVYDDCLDLFGSEAAAGKSLGTDLANGKLTLPVLVALERATAAEQATLKQFVQTWDRSALVHVQELLGKYEALAESRRAIHQYLSAARECLTALPETESVVALIGLTDFLAQQTDALGAGRT
jgi:octaprenyl-diphosphate synthase